MTRMKLVRDSEAYQKARPLPKTIKKNKKTVANSKRKNLFAEARKQYRYSIIGVFAISLILIKYIGRIFTTT